MKFKYLMSIIFIWGFCYLGIHAQELVPELATPFIMVGTSIHPSQTSGYLMVGEIKRLGHIGYYGSLKSNFNFNGQNAGSVNSGDYLFFSGYEEKGRLAITGGALWRISSPLTVHGGLGYGNRWVDWGSLSGKIYKVSDLSYSGVEVEAGIIYSYQKILCSIGLSTTAFEFMETNIGLGIKF